MARGSENQRLPLSSLGDSTDKNIYGQFSSLWGQAGYRMGLFFFLLGCGCPVGWQGQTQAVSLRDTGLTQGLLSEWGHSRPITQPLPRCQEELGMASVFCWLCFP